MHIAYDSNIFTIQKYGGVSRYFVMLGEELSKAGHNVRAYGLLHTNQHLFDSSYPLTGMHMIGHFPPYTRRATHFLNDLWMQFQIKMEVPDLIHETYCQNRKVGKKSIPRVCTVHDMIHELFPEFIGKRDRTPEYRLNTIFRADAVICVSEKTRLDLVRFTGIDEDKVHVVHHGFENVLIHEQPTEDDLLFLNKLKSKPYLLYVGARQGYKNFANFLRGYAASSLISDLQIVAFGGNSFNPSELALSDSLGIPRCNIIQLGGSDALLHSLYHGALAFIYPSLYEGFGFPPLEAMSKNCPVISSNASCMPEIIGDAAEFFDPLDPYDIASAIERVSSSEALRHSLINKGKKRLKKFSWKKCADETLKVYERVL
jgi:glycosyltransferase involved in cell wall biosynthesis